MNRRWLLIIVSFLTIFSLAASGWLFYQNLQLQKQISQLQTQPSPSPAASPVVNPTANWKTYTNPSLKYLLKYPQSWEIQEYPDADLPYVLHRLELRNNNKPQLVIEIYKELRVKTVPEDKVVRSEQITISGVTGTKNWHNSFGPPAEIIIIFDTKTYRILLQDANQNQTVDQILSTFKFTNTLNQEASPTLSLTIVKILDTSNWTERQCGKISFKLPPEYNNNCSDYPDKNIKDAYITKKDSNLSYSAIIQVREYNGGSRRQYWINAIKATPDSIAKYIRFQETQFGSVVGLDVFGSGGWWQGGYASPILIAHNKTLVLIHGGRDFDDQTGKITRWNFTDTIASTIKFIN